MDRNIWSLAVNKSFCFDGELLLFSSLTRDSPKTKSSCYTTDIPKVRMSFLGLILAMLPCDVDSFREIPATHQPPEYKYMFQYLSGNKVRLRIMKFCLEINWKRTSHLPGESHSSSNYPQTGMKRFPWLLMLIFLRCLHVGSTYLQTPDSWKQSLIQSSLMLV